MQHSPLVLAALVLATTAAVLPARAGDGPARNRLADAESPYLLLHADNPVDWYPWGPEAFARARAENKPIFLSVGYSTCFWCHVAERTLYSDPAIAALMNRWFVNVKVDREQRPDVDRAYMVARQLISGTGGWPNNVFLTPDGEPFFAGSYFPPARDEQGRPGFPQVLEALHRTWVDRRAEVLADAARVREALARIDAPGATGGAPVAPAAWHAEVRRELLARFDALQGGFADPRSPTRFPQTPSLDFLLDSVARSKDEAVVEALTETLDAMAWGGIHDHLAGGFHRYSTDPDWSIPHFEKMLYDNVQLLAVYAEAYRAFGLARHRHVAEGIARYLQTRMRSEEGGFFTAEDAQVDGVEGLSYVWTAGEIVDVLGEERAQRFFAIYALEELPHSAAALKAAGAPVPEGAGVLRVRVPVEEALEASGHAKMVGALEALAPARAALLARRDRRPPPLRDEKLGVDLNGLAVAGFARAGRALGEPRYVAIARRAAEHVWSVAFDEESGALAHQIFRGRAGGAGFLADYAHLARAFLTLHAVTGEPTWQARARQLADALLGIRFVGADGRLALSLAAGELPLALSEDGDFEVPSATSSALAVLLELAGATNEPRYRDAAARILRHRAAGIAGHPGAWPTLVAALATEAARPVVETARIAADDAPAAASSSASLPVTADHVRAQLTLDARASRATVTLEVSPGYHVNANPASHDYLIPTAVAFDGATPASVAYPPPKPFKPSFSETALDVYEGEVAIAAAFPPGALADPGAVRVTVTVQACNDTVCLPPSRMELRSTD